MVVLWIHKHIINSFHRVAVSPCICNYFARPSMVGDPACIESGTEAGGNSISSISSFRFTGGVWGCAKSSSSDEYQPPIVLFFFYDGILFCWWKRIIGKQWSGNGKEAAATHFGLTPRIMRTIHQMVIVATATGSWCPSVAAGWGEPATTTGANENTIRNVGKSLEMKGRLIRSILFD